jgi:hypothetical protein
MRVIEIHRALFEQALQFRCATVVVRQQQAQLDVIEWFA